MRLQGLALAGAALGMACVCAPALAGSQASGKTVMRLEVMGGPSGGNPAGGSGSFYAQVGGLSRSRNRLLLLQRLERPGRPHGQEGRPRPPAQGSAVGSSCRQRGSRPVDGNVVDPERNARLRRSQGRRRICRNHRPELQGRPTSRGVRAIKTGMSVCVGAGSDGAQVMVLAGTASVSRRCTMARRKRGSLATFGVASPGGQALCVRGDAPDGIHDCRRAEPTRRTTSTVDALSERHERWRHPNGN